MAKSPLTRGPLGLGATHPRSGSSTTSTYNRMTTMEVSFATAEKKYPKDRKYLNKKYLNRHLGMYCTYGYGDVPGIELLF